MKKKRCSTCGPQPIVNFSKNAAKKDGLCNYCKTCQSRYGKSHYSRNKPSYLRRASRQNAAILREWREIVKTAKAQPCVDCHVSYPTYVMDFDHVRGVKRFNIAAGRRLGFSIQQLCVEIDKCDVICANCHRERTFRPHSSSG